MIPLRTWRSSKGLIMPFSSAICLIHRSLLITVKPSYSPVGPGVKSWAGPRAPGGLVGLLPAGTLSVHVEGDGLAGGAEGAEGIFHGAVTRSGASRATARTDGPAPLSADPSAPASRAAFVTFSSQGK